MNSIDKTLQLSSTLFVVELGNSQDILEATEWVKFQPSQMQLEDGAQQITVELVSPSGNAYRAVVQLGYPIGVKNLVALCWIYQNEQTISLSNHTCLIELAGELEFHTAAANIRLELKLESLNF
jgi:hypothetical protein